MFVTSVQTLQDFVIIYKKHKDFICILCNTLIFNIHGFVHRNNILVYISNYMHNSQSLFNLTTTLHVSGVTITHLQEHQTTVTTASGNRYTVLLSAAIAEELEPV
jgi:hypothetical protein